MNEQRDFIYNLNELFVVLITYLFFVLINYSNNIVINYSNPLLFLVFIFWNKFWIWYFIKGWPNLLVFFKLWNIFFLLFIFLFFSSSISSFVLFLFKYFFLSSLFNLLFFSCLFWLLTSSFCSSIFSSFFLPNKLFSYSCCFLSFSKKFDIFLFISSSGFSFSSLISFLYALAALVFKCFFSLLTKKNYDFKLYFFLFSPLTLNECFSFLNNEQLIISVLSIIELK